MEDKDKIIELSEFGEFGLIKHLTEKIKLKNTSSEYGVGDDAAVLNYGNRKTLITTDLLIEGIHFNLIYTPLKHLGYKAVVVNLSDIYAMNGQPKQITVSIAISKKFSLQAIEELYEGIHLACENYNIDLIGGDTSSSLTGLAISITAIGEANENEITYRNGANENDLICVTGDLGAAYMGLQLLERENKVFLANPNEQPELIGYEYILERQLKPEARKDIIEKLKQANIMPTSMIDISDGLSSEIMHICSQSKKGCKIFQEKLPIDKETGRMAKELNIEPLIPALNGGEDYELLFTIPLNDHEKIKEIKDISVIGHICKEEDNVLLITPDGTGIELLAQGWNSI
ncbi:thiamine-phosphate kinase [Bacteroidota bacterium]